MSPRVIPPPNVGLHERDAFVAAELPKARNKNQKYLINIIDEFLKYLDAVHGWSKLKTVGTNELTGFVDRQKRKHVKRSTASTKIRAVYRFLTWLNESNQPVKHRLDDMSAEEIIRSTYGDAGR